MGGFLAQVSFVVGRLLSTGAGSKNEKVLASQSAKAGSVASRGGQHKQPNQGRTNTRPSPPHHHNRISAPPNQALHLTPMQPVVVVALRGGLTGATAGFLAQVSLGR